MKFFRYFLVILLGMSFLTNLNADAAGKGHGKCDCSTCKCTDGSNNCRCEKECKNCAKEHKSR
jgi:hypothetical protein